MRVVYLHGFASSPRSSKAQFFHRQLTGLGVKVEIPRLDAGDFERMTVTTQLRVVDQAVAGRECVLFGSSLGGYLAALYAAEHKEVHKLVLLAPAFQFPSRWRQRYTPAELAQWQADGSAPVFHYGEGREARLGYRFMEDSVQYPEEPDARQPALIFHGTKDDIVPAEVSRRFAAGHPNATVVELDSGHELTDVLDPMWERTREFLEL